MYAPNSRAGREIRGPKPGYDCDSEVPEVTFINTASRAFPEPTKVKYPGNGPGSLHVNKVPRWV